MRTLVCRILSAAFVYLRPRKGPLVSPSTFLIFEDRPSDSPFIERVWRSQSIRAGTFLSVAASHCEIVIARHRGLVRVTLRGPETRATSAECPAHYRLEHPLATHVLFPVYVAVFVWGGLALRSPRLLAVLTGER